MGINFYKARKWLLSMLCAVFTCCAIITCVIYGTQTADALPQVPDSTTVTARLYDFDKYCYDTSAMDQLASLILTQQQPSATNKNFNALINYAKSVAGNNGRKIVNKSITLKYGRFRYTEQSATYSDLKWMPVYISTNTSGEAVLTLYLAATETTKATSQQEQGYFSAQGLYSTNYDIGAPSNSYGSSHMRAISLGGERPDGTGNASYATYPSGTYRLKEDPSITQSNCNKFSDFIRGFSTVNNVRQINFTGAFYDDISTPAEMTWQKNESFAEYSSEFVTSGFSTTYANYCWPNEAYGTPKSGSYYLPGYFDYAGRGRTQYSDWQYDKVWLPSLTEVGDGDKGGDDVDKTNGIWGLTASQRSNTQKSWLRTAKTTAAKTTDSSGNSYSTYTMFCIDTDGSISESDMGTTNLNAIRPAIHLNLDRIAKKTTPAVKLPDVITSIYNGEVQTEETIADDQKSGWYDPTPGAMTVTFWADNNHMVAPIDAGTYYMAVQLDTSSDKQFFGDGSYPEFGENSKMRVTKFVIEKIKLDLTWEYDESGIPTGVSYDESQIYSRDLKPEIGLYYKNIISGRDYYDINDIDEVAHYRAYPYIVNEEMYRYNYEIDTSIRSDAFFVDKRALPVPEFVYGPSDIISPDHTQLTLAYKGKNFVQIKNISPTMIIKVTSNSESALANLKDLGLQNGVQTYEVKDVAQYTFTVTLSDTDKANAYWASNSGVSDDITDKKLVLGINQAVITVSFDGLLSSWDTVTDMPFTLGIVGIQSGDGVPMTVTYQSAKGGGKKEIKPDDNGRYLIPKGLAIGEYVISAVIEGSGQLNGPYKMERAAAQKFTITQAKSSFGADLVTWKYTIKGANRPCNDIGSGNSPSNPIELDFVDDYYQFTLQLDENRLKNYYVKANYSGATYVKDAGSYSVTVTISAYDQNVSFETQTYTVYFNIKKGSFDMSGVRWNYTNALEENGSEQKVLLTGVPAGLTVSYSGNKATSRGTYTAEATFSVSEDYANNYAVPEKMNLEWQIVNKNIETFTVNGATVHFEINSVAFKSGDSFPYNPSGYTVRAVAESGSFNESDYRIEYYFGSSSASGITDIGSYRVTLVPQSGGGAVAEISFTIVKAEFDTSGIELRYSRNDEIIKTAKWDADQKKWYDLSGKEFVLSFVYDGTEQKIELDGSVSGLLLGTPSNNVYKNAGTYTARFNLTSMDGNYNIPAFDSITWTIEKAEINFDNVRWGYIDSDGNEYDTDFEGNPFTFTRDENGPVNFTVGLINLPAGLRVNYSTVCLTKSNSSAIPGNSFSEAGDYQTSFTRNVNFNDPNYVSVTTIPAFIPSFQYWKIQERQFTPLNHNVDWKEFDNRTHDLVELCGLPKDELAYFRVEIAFLDGNNVLENYYEGYEGVQYSAYHAGTYIVRFFELRGADETEYFWDSVEIEVGKEKLEVTWDEKGSIPVARVTGLYVSDMIGTKYTTADGTEVRVEYIMATQDGSVFYAEPYLMNEYTGDLEIVMANGEPEKKEFTYEYFEYDPATTYEIDKSAIRFRNAEMPYTGYPVTFEILNFDSNYLYYEGDSLSQTKPGKYSIDINFIKYTGSGVGNACWMGTSGDRRTLTLTFEITSPTSVALEYPHINTNMAVYTGKPITFTITNWAVLKEYLTYEVLLNGVKVGDEWLTYTQAGNYTVKFSFREGSIGYWNDDPSDPHKEYTLSFRIVEPDGTPLTLPTLVQSSKEATGSPITFEIANWDSYYANYCELIGNLTVTSPGSYSVKVAIKSGFPDLKFTNGQREYTLYFSVTEPDTPDGPKHIPLPSVPEAEKQFTGNEIQFIENWSELSEYVEIVGHSGWQYTQREVGDYTFYLHIKDQYKGTVVWADGTDGDKVISYRIIPATVDTDKLGAGSDGKVTVPNGDGENVILDDFLDYKYFDKDGNEVSAGDLKDGEEYTVEVTLNPDREEEFNKSFSNAEELKAALRNNGSYTFTYDSGADDDKLLIIVAIAEAVVLVFLIIATIVVLAIQHKIYDEEEDEYDRYDDYEEDDEY